MNTELQRTLEREVAGVLDYVPCKWHGCAKERHYTTGAGAGYCDEHGLVLFQRAQAKGVEVRRSNGGYAGAPKGEVTVAAKRVLEASRKLEATAATVYKAKQKRAEAAQEWRQAVKELIAAGQLAVER